MCWCREGITIKKLCSILCDNIRGGKQRSRIIPSSVVYLIKIQAEKRQKKYQRFPHKRIGNGRSVKLAQVLICCRFYYFEKKSPWAQSSKVSTLAATELESSKVPSQQDCLKTFFLLFLKYTFMFLRSLISNLMSDCQLTAVNQLSKL